MIAELLGGLPLGDIGLTGLAILYTLAVMTGKLVPKSTMDKAEKNSDKWQEAYMTQQAVNVEHSGSLGELLASSRATTHALQEIQAAGSYAMAQRRIEETP